MKTASLLLPRGPASSGGPVHLDIRASQCPASLTVCAPPLARPLSMAPPTVFSHRGSGKGRRALDVLHWPELSHMTAPCEEGWEAESQFWATACCACAHVEERGSDGSYSSQAEAFPWWQRVQPWSDWCGPRSVDLGVWCQARWLMWGDGGSMAW